MFHKAVRSLAVAGMVAAWIPHALLAQAGPLGGNPGAAQTDTANGAILGRVIDAATNRPISGATATLAGGPPQVGANGLPIPPPAVITNTEGFFLFRNLAKGTYPITVMAPGYLQGANGRALPEGPSRPVRLEQDQRVVDVVIKLWRFGAISGRVLDETGEPAVGAQVRALRRVGGRLTYAPPTQSVSAQTDDRGMYRLSSLVPGEYVVSVPSLTTTYPAELATQGPIAMLELRRNLPPLVGANMAMATLNGEGMRVGDLSIMQDAGRPGPEPGADGRVLGYRTIFHPSATTPAAATTIAVRSGEEKSDVDIQLQLSPMLRISGTLTGPEGPAGSVGVRLLPTFADGFAVDGNFDAALTFSGPDGRFTFLGVPPGQYTVKATRLPRPTPQPAGGPAATVINMNLGGGGSAVMMMSAGPASLPPASAEPTLSASVPVTVADRDLTAVDVLLRHGARVSGRLVFEGSDRPAASELQRFGVSITPIEGTALTQPVPIDAEGQFTTAQVPDGKYVIAPGPVPPGWYVKSAMSAGRNAYERPIDLGGEDVTGVLITMTKQAAELSGTMRRSGTSADPNAVVVVFPADSQAWIDEGMLARRARSVAVQADGSYAIAGLGADTYSVAAVPADTLVDLRNPATIGALARIAMRVAVADGEKKVVPLTLSQLR